MNLKIFRIVLVISKKMKILSIILWILLLYLLPEYKFNIFPMDKNNDIIIESSTPMISQTVIEDVITNPLESILSTKNYIQSYETMIENGRFRIKVTLHDKIEPLTVIQNLKREIVTLEKNLPSEYSRIRIFKHSSEDEPDLIFAFDSDTLSKSYILSHLKVNLIKAILNHNGVKQVKIYGNEKYNYSLNYDSKKIFLQKVNTSQLLLDLSNITSQMLDKDNTNRVEGWNPLLDYKDKIQLTRNIVMSSDSFAIKKEKSISTGIHRINSKELAVICIYSDNFLTSTYLYNLIQFNTFLNFYSLSEDVKIIPIYFSFYQNIKYTIENVIFILVPVLFILLKYIHKKKYFLIQFIRSTLNSLPILFFSIYLMDKNIDISLVYSLIYSFLFIYFNLSKLNSIQNPKKYFKIYLELFIKLIINSMIIYLIIKILKENGTLVFKILIQYISFTLYFIFHYLLFKPEKKYSYSIRFISFQIFKIISFILNHLVKLNNHINSIFNNKFSKLKIYTERFNELHKKYQNRIPNYSYSLIIFLLFLSICKLISIDFPSQKGEVIMGILEMPSGYNLSNTESISRIIESNLLSTRKVFQIYSHIQNEHVKYYLKLNENEELSKAELKQISKLANPGYFYIPSQNNKNNTQEIQFIGNNYNTIQKSISLFTKKILQSNPEVEVILKYKPPFQNLLMTPDSQKLSFANIPPSSFSYNTKIQLSGAIFTRIFEKDEIVDFRLQDKNKPIAINHWNNDFQTHNQSILYNNNYSDFQYIEEFSIYRKKNGKKILSLLLKDFKDQDFLTEVINELEKSNEVVIQIINSQVKDSYFYLFILSILLL